MNFLPGQHSATFRRQKTSGFSLIETLISLILFGVTSIIFGATFPRAIEGSGAASTNAQAVLLAQHKIDQLRQAGFSQLQDAAALRQMGIIDNGLNADGSFSFTTVDNLSDSGSVKGYFGSANGVALGTGKIFIGSALTGQGASAPSTLKALQVTVTISWSGSGMHAGSCTQHTIIAAP